VKAVVQRVRHACVSVGGERIAQIGAGMVVLLGVAEGDSEKQARWMADKLASLRFFEDEQGKMNLSIQETGGSALCISQFTLLGACRKGRRPSFSAAASPDLAEPLYDTFCELLQERGIGVFRGIFGAHMQVELCNDGPVTLIVDTPDGL